MQHFHRDIWRHDWGHSYTTGVNESVYLLGSGRWVPLSSVSPTLDGGFVATTVDTVFPYMVAGQKPNVRPGGSSAAMSILGLEATPTGTPDEYVLSTRGQATFVLRNGQMTGFYNNSILVWNGGALAGDSETWGLSAPKGIIFSYQDTYGPRQQDNTLPTVSVPQRVDWFQDQGSGVIVNPDGSLEDLNADLPDAPRIRTLAYADNGTHGVVSQDWDKAFTNNVAAFNARVSESQPSGTMTWQQYMTQGQLNAEDYAYLTGQNVNTVTAAQVAGFNQR
ncbi:MAG: hypothetical protein HQL13_08710, partial [Candidatus Omnitrophica bacterium]|nr:hypothetical protein [Candidatus Omnitrophota bacterium]